MKKALLIALAVVCVAAFGVQLYLKGKTYEVVITQEQIDEALEAKFPVAKDFLLIFTITYSNPEVILLAESDRIRVRMDAELTIRLGDQPKKFGGHCELTSGLAFRPETHEFFLSDTRFDRVELEGIPQEHLDKVTDFVTQSARFLIDRFPVYQLRATDTRSAVAKMILKDVQIRDQTVQVTLGL